MVFLKVSDGYETRKLQLTEELSLDQLKQQLSRFFPRLSENDFSLQYRDEDGDLITLSTDEELQAVLATLPQDAVWRVQLKEKSETSSSLFDRLFEPHRRPFGLFSWRYGSWEPRIYESPFGHVTVIGPVGYHACTGRSGSGQKENKTKAAESQSEAAEQSPSEPQRQAEGEATTEQ